MWSRALLLATCGAAVLAACPTAAPAQRAQDRCHPPDSRTVAVNRWWRIYTQRSGSSSVGQPLRRIYACSARSHRRRFIGHLGVDSAFSEYGAIVSPRLAGHYLAYGDSFGCNRYYGDCTGQVAVRDLLRRRPARVLEIGIHTGPWFNALRLHDLQLNADGAAAFVIGTFAAAASFELYRLDADPGLVATGPGIDPASLALGGRRMYWIQDGSPQTSEIH